MPKANEERIVVMVPAKMKERFMRAAKARGKTLAYVLRNLIEDWEAENRAGPGRPKKAI